MNALKFNANFRKLDVKKSAEGSIDFSIMLDGITGLDKRTQELVDTMSGPVIVTLIPTQSTLEFGKTPDLPKEKGVKPATSKSAKTKDKK